MFKVGNCVKIKDFSNINKDTLAKIPLVFESAIHFCRQNAGHTFVLSEGQRTVLDIEVVAIPNCGTYIPTILIHPAFKIFRPICKSNSFAGQHTDCLASKT